MLQKKGIQRVEDSLPWVVPKGNGESLGSTYISSSLGQCWLIDTEIGIVIGAGTLSPLHFGATHNLTVGLTSLVVAAECFGGPWAWFTSSAFYGGCFSTWFQLFPWGSTNFCLSGQPVAISLGSGDWEEEILGASQSLPCGNESHNGTALQHKMDVIFKEISCDFKKCFFSEVFIFLTVAPSPSS